MKSVLNVSSIYTIVDLWRIKSIVVKVEGKPTAEWIRRETETRKLDALGVNCVGDDTDGGSAIACDSQLQQWM